MAYKDLVIRLSRSQEKEYQFLASALEAGKQVASNSFEFRLDELIITHPMLELEKEAVNPQSNVTSHKDLGQVLFRKVFAGEIGDYFQRHLQGNGDGLRIGLQFDESASRLSKLPWEFLHDGENFLVSRPKILLSRLPSNGGRTNTSPIESILKMLVIVSAPKDPRCRPLNVEYERDKILQAVDQLIVKKKIEVDFTDDATFETIQGYLLENYHIVHFTGHGDEKNGQGYLILEGESLQAVEADDQVVCDLFAEKGIRLVVLSACKSASLAEKLARKGVPAVLAMQYPVGDESATQFAYTFYKSLASGHPVDASLVEARQSMKNADGANGIDFATPVLYQLDPHCLNVSRIQPAGIEMLDNPLLLDPKIQVMNYSFVGRHRELHRLKDALLSCVKRALLINGWGGMGKTVLATRLATRLSDSFEGIYGHRCNPQTRTEDILIGLNSFLNMAGIDSLNSVLNSPAPISVKTAMLVRILNQRRFLIILDNFESCLDEGGKQIADPELRDFVSSLLSTTASNTKYIITSRVDFDPLEGRLVSAVEHYPLPEMPYYEAIWLMNNHTSLARLDFGKKKQIHKAVGGHPWSIDQFAMQVSEGSEVDDILNELEPLAKEARAFTLFNRAYSQLDDESRELLLRASIFEEAVPEEALRWMMGDEKMPSPPVRRALRELQRWGLAARQEEREVKVYSVHTLVRQFVQQGATKTGIDLCPLLVRAAQHYEMQVKVNRSLWDHLRARDYYYRAKKYERAADIVTAAWPYLARWGYFELAMSLLQQSADTNSGATKAIAIGNLAVLYHAVCDWKTALKLHREVKEIFEAQGDRKKVATVLHQLGMVHQSQGNYPEAVKHYEQSLEIFNSLGDKSGIASSLRQLGMVHQSQGNYPEAVKHYEQSLEIFKSLGDKFGIASSLHQLGMVHQSQGNYPEAVKHYEQSLEIFKSLGDISGIASSLHQLGMVHQSQGNYSEAVKLYEKSLEIFNSLGDKFGIASSLHQLGTVHQSQGNYPEAVEYYEQSLEMAKSLGDKSGIASSLHQLGMVHQSQGNYPEAVGYYEQSLEMAKSLGDKSGIASSLHQLGMVHQSQGNYPEAVKHYEQSLEIKKSLGDISGIARSLHQLGNVHYDQGNYPEAVKHYEQSLEIKKSLGDISGIARSLHQLGNVHYDQGNYPEAVKHYEQSLEIFESLGDKFGIASSLHQLGTVHYDQGNYPEAVKHYEQSLEIKKSLGDISGIASSLHQLGMVHQSQGNYPEAVKHYEQSLEIFKSLGDKSGIASSLHQLGNVHYDQGNYPEAVEYYEQSLEMAKSLGDKSGIASSLGQLGMVHQSQGNNPEAAKHYEQSLEIFKSLGAKSGIARSLGQMGRIKEENEDLEGALENYIIAQSIFEELQSPDRDIAKKDIARLRERMGEEAFQCALAKSGGSQWARIK